MIRRFGETPEPGRTYIRRVGAYELLPRGDGLLLTCQADPDPDLQLPGGGIDPSVALVKVELRGGFASTEEARAWVCPQFVSSSYHFWCLRHYQAMGMNWQPSGGLGCGLSNLPEATTVPDTNGCQ